MKTQNRISLIAEITKDPELKQTTQSVVTTLSLQTSEDYKDKEGNWKSSPEYHSAVIWGKEAERAVATLRNGDFLYLEGRLKVRGYKTASGDQKYVTEIKTQKFFKIEHATVPSTVPTMDFNESEISIEDLPF